VIYADDSASRGVISATYQWEMGEIRADSFGRFTVEVHPEKDFIVEASHPDFLGEISSPMRLGPAESRTQVNLSLGRGESFEGEIRDENGAIVAGAQVQLTETEERPELKRFVSFELLKQRTRTTVSGEDGKYKFDRVAPTARQLSVTHPKYRSVRHDVQLISNRQQAPTIMTPKSIHER
jgi:hypothetical protein